jgi:PAS domain S-box-containing protein
MTGSVNQSKKITSSDFKATRLLFLLLVLFLIGFVTLISLNKVIDRLIDDLEERGANEQARLFVGEELVRTIKTMELDFNRMFVSTSTLEHERLQSEIIAKSRKLAHDLLVLKDGGEVERTVDLNVENVDNMQQKVRYAPRPDDPTNLLELVEIGPYVDKVREKSTELASLLLRRELARGAGNSARLYVLEEELNLYFKHVPSLFIRLNENANRLFYESNNRTIAFEESLSRKRTSYKRVRIGLELVIVVVVMGTGVLLARQLSAVNLQLVRSSEELLAAKEHAEQSNQVKSESLILLEQEMAERQKIEEALHTHTAQMRCITDSANDAILMMDSKGIITYWNPAAERILGHSRLEALGNNLHNLIAPERYRASHHAAFPSFVHTGQGDAVGKTLELIAIHKDGREIPVALSLSGVYMGGSWHAVGVLRDISELKHYEDELKQLNETLEGRVAEEVLKNREKDSLLLHQEKLASIGQLAAGVAHEINNPIGFVMSNLNTLKEYSVSLKKYCETVDASLGVTTHPDLLEAKKRFDLAYILEDIQPLLAESLEGAERVRRIVLDLKDFARPDEREMHEADLNQLIQSTINIVRNELKYVAELDLQLGNLPRIICHPQQINQVISNLLVNAAHAIEQHGLITVRTSHEGSGVVLTVTDTGRGIPTELLNRIFDPFFTTKEVGKGTGLGLSISYDIVQKHGGTISVVSEVGVGTTFTVLLPVDAGASVC